MYEQCISTKENIVHVVHIKKCGYFRWNVGNLSRFNVTRPFELQVSLRQLFYVVERISGRRF